MAFKTIIVLAMQLLAVTKATALQADLSCADPTNGTYSNSAFICNDSLTSTQCSILFKLNNTAEIPAAGNVFARPETCYKLAGANPEDQKNSAISMCPKTCGLCCLTPAFSCQNSPNPIHFSKGCSEVNQAQCKDPEWKTLIARDCPNVCGFCQEDGCKDAVNYCDTSLCNNIHNQDFVKKNCIKTCGLCSNSPVNPVVPATTQPGNIATTMGPGPVVTLATGAPSTRCIDHKNCAGWARNGYCSNPFYTDADRVKYCPNTCGLCSSIGK